ncbi:hypothetical protein [Litoreibacter ponti]|uniref:hypothetical protein n=1 Tax=Litoreibacter ponti TaxID=1510457 RepID=UPI000D31F53A|nr:hypothetical protein [Litoreibacter ponti]
MKIFKAAVVAACLATPAYAVNCTFTTECFESEACAETSYEIAIEQDGEATKLVSVAETIPVSRGGSDSARVYVGVTDSAFHLLSRNADGNARYTTHMYQGPMVVSYLGTCEEPS